MTGFSRTIDLGPLSFSAIAAARHDRGGWIHPGTPPARPGLYERQSYLGLTVDVWDGRQWRRKSSEHSVDPAGLGVICANQNLPWRPLE